jgi:hypothetical protein
MDQAATLSQIISLAAQLPAAEQKQLAEVLLRGLANAPAPPRAGRKWSEIRGAAPYPLCGEDAQEWVSRTRAESDEGRGRRGGHP